MARVGVVTGAARPLRRSRAGSPLLAAVVAAVAMAGPAAAHATAQEDDYKGADLWLRYQPVSDQALLDAYRDAITTIVARREHVRFLLQATNVGNASAGNVRLCARGPQRRIAISGTGCVTRAMPPGASRKHAVNVRIKPASRGRVTPIRLTARGPDIANRSTRVRLRVRR